MLLLQLLLFEAAFCTPGGVDSNRSGTIGEGDVIELKLEYVADCPPWLDWCTNGMCWELFIVLEDGVAGCAKSTILSKLSADSRFWLWLVLLGKVTDDKDVFGASNSAGGWSVGFDGSSSSSNIQRGGWLGICDILQCNKLLSISEDFEGKVTENEDEAKDGGVGGASGDNCWVCATFCKPDFASVLISFPISPTGVDKFVTCNADCNWW